MIEINNLTTSKIDEVFLKKVAEKVLKRERKDKESQLSIALIGPGRMRKFNKKYRGKNRVTDVLAFEGKKTRKAKFVMPPEITQGLGEVVICIREIKKRSKALESDFRKELSVSLIHGILHLLGYDHQRSEKEAEKMQAKQDYYLSRLGFRG